MHGVVILHPVVNQSKGSGSIRDRVHPELVALEGLQKRLSQAVIRHYDFGPVGVRRFLKNGGMGEPIRDTWQLDWIFTARLLRR